jgi:Ca2+/Na+ antiporter
MFLDFFRIAGLGHSMLFLDLASRVLFIVLCALILLIIGYKIRRPLGAGFVLVYGFFIYMCNYGQLRF